MWGRVGNINKIEKNGEDEWAQITYYPYRFACPISQFSIIQTLDGDIKLNCSLAGLPNLEGLMQLLATKEGGELLEGTWITFYHDKVKQEDIAWFIKLMNFINMKFEQPFFDKTIIAEVNQVFNWLQTNALTKSPYQHLVSEIASPMASYINPELTENISLFDLIRDLNIENEKITTTKILDCLSAGENPNQKNHCKDNPLDELLCHGVNLGIGLSSEDVKKIEFFLMELTVVFLCYGLNPFSRQNFFYFSTFELAARLSLWSVYDVIIKSISKPQRESLLISQESVDYIENDKIYTELPLQLKNIRTCVMPTHHLRKDAIMLKSLFAVFIKNFASANVDPQKMFAAFCHDLLHHDKIIEIFFHNKKVVGYNLTYFEINHERKNVIYRSDYCLLYREYQQLGLIAYTYPRMVLAIKLHLGNIKEMQDYRVLFHCECASEGSYHLFKKLLHHPKQTTPELSREEKAFTEKVFGDTCVHVHNGITCYVEDEVTVKSEPDPNRGFNLISYFFNHFLRGLPRESNGQPKASNRSVPTFICIGQQYLEHWIALAKKIGALDPYAQLLNYAGLFGQVTWSNLPKNPSRKLSYHGAFQDDLLLFFKNKRIPVRVHDKPMPGCSRS